MKQSTSTNTTRSNGNHSLGFTGRITRAAPSTLAHSGCGRSVGGGVAAAGVNVSHDTATAGTEATRANDLIEQRLRTQTAPEEFIIVESPSASANDPAFATFVDSLTKDLTAATGVASVNSYRGGAEGLVSQDGHTVLVTATLTGDKADATDTAEPMLVVRNANGTDGFRVTTVGRQRRQRINTFRIHSHRASSSASGSPSWCSWSCSEQPQLRAFRLSSRSSPYSSRSAPRPSPATPSRCQTTSPSSSR
jgi:hypothetical protein